MIDDRRPWFLTLTGYHWFVLAVAALGWLFDTMDQQLFVLARPYAMGELLNTEDVSEITKYSTYATSIFLLGWASGGLFFGVLGDVIGRAKTMLITILVYSLFTGLSAFSVGFSDFAIYRFLTGLGVGGEFAVGVALVAEAIPAHARPKALALVQALSAVGNVSAAFILIAVKTFVPVEASETFPLFGFPMTGWRIMFLVGTAPALLAIVIRFGLKEPEKWQAEAANKAFGSRLEGIAELFTDGRWLRNAMVGLGLAASGVIALWGIAFFVFDLTGEVLEQSLRKDAIAARPVAVITEVQQTDRPTAEAAPRDETPLAPDVVLPLTPQEEESVNTKAGQLKGVAGILFNVGAFFGIYFFGIMAERIGRRGAFAVCYLIAGASTIFVFYSLSQASDIYWMMPLLGFCVLSIFGGFAVYFPELFPTRLRSTGTSFCYNVGRFVAAIGPFLLGALIEAFKDPAEPESTWPLRLAGMVMCSIYLLGLAVLPFAPETKGQPLPE